MTADDFQARVKAKDTFRVGLLPSKKFWVIRALNLSGDYYDIVDILSVEQVADMTTEELDIKLNTFILDRCFG